MARDRATVTTGEHVQAPAAVEVFFDPSGRRWRRVKRWILAMVVVAGAAFLVSWGPMRSPRAAREGHAIANHTMNHPEPTVASLGPEIVTADRVITATTNIRSDLFRLPYGGDTSTGTLGEGELVLEAQRLGYQVSLQDFDPSDWKYGAPEGPP